MNSKVKSSQVTWLFFCALFLFSGCGQKPTLATPAVTASPITSATAVPTRRFTPTPAFQGRIIFTTGYVEALAQMFNEPMGMWNIFTMGVDGTGLEYISGGLFSNGLAWPEDVSADGKFALVAASTSPSIYDDPINAELSVYDLRTYASTRLTPFFRHSGNSASLGAYFRPDGRVVFIAHPDPATEPVIFMSNLDGTDQRQLTSGGPLPVELYPTVDESSVYWRAGCTTEDPETTCGYFKTNLEDGSSEEIWLGLRIHEVSRTLNRIVYDGLTIADLYAENPLSVPDPGCFQCASLSPDGAIMAQQEYPSGLTRLLYIADNRMEYMPNIGGWEAYPHWSPDGRYLLVGEYLFNAAEKSVYKIAPQPYRFKVLWLP